MEPVTALLQPPGPHSWPGELGHELTTPVGTLMLRAAPYVSPDDTVADAARAMREAQTSSALVRGQPLGILTSGDLRSRVLAEGLPASTPVSTVMTRQVRALPEDAPLYAALLLMLDEGFEHVPITRGGEVIGVVTHLDMLRYQARSPMLLLGQIRSVDRLEALDGYSDQVAAAAGALLADGVQAIRVSRVISGLNDALSGRLIQLAQEQLGPPPCPYTWLALGSEGRMEQVLLSDQDNALVYQDDTPQTAEYFEALAGMVVDGLLHAGFPRCPGGYMAVNWCRPMSAFQRTFYQWIHRPEPKAMVEASVFLDFRAAHGSLSVTPLSDVLLAARRAPNFLSSLARSAGSFTPPLGIFGQVRTKERHVDLKIGGLAAVVIMARIFALEAGSSARPTLERLEDAAQAGVLSVDGAAGLADAFRLLVKLRLREQLRRVAAGQVPDNRVCFDDLTGVERRRLRDAFRTVSNMQKITTNRLPSA